MLPFLRKLYYFQDGLYSFYGDCSSNGRGLSQHPPMWVLCPQMPPLRIFARPRANTQQNKENVHNGVVEEKGKRAQWGS